MPSTVLQSKIYKDSPYQSQQRKEDKNCQLSNK